MGDSRYVVEPNLKEGKGGLRDLHTLFWIGKFAYQTQSVPDLVEQGLLTRPELRQFQKAENFLWAVRCHLHFVAKRPEARLPFDVQPEIARRMIGSATVRERGCELVLITVVYGLLKKKHHH